MSDDPPKPRRARSHMGDDDRALAGLEHRKRTTPLGHRTVSDATPEPTPEDQDDSDGTPLGDELPADAELTGPSERVLADPTALELWHHVERVAKRGNRRDRAANSRINQVHADAGNQHTGAAIKKQASQVRVIWGLLVAIGTASGGSLIAVAKGLYEKGDAEGALRIRIEHFERDVERQRLDLRDLRDRLDDRHSPRRFDSQPDRAGFLTPPLPPPAPKGTAP